MKMYDRERLNVLGVLLDHIDYCEACQRLNTFLNPMITK